MAEYIDKQKAIEIASGYCHPANIAAELAKLPAADVVSRGAYDQTDWERCVAMTQLKEIDKSLGERMDDMRPVVKAKWEENKRGSYCVVCSNCGFGFPTGFVWYDCNRASDEREFSIMTEDADLNFCPNCGADMREES